MFRRMILIQILMKIALIFITRWIAPSVDKEAFLMESAAPLVETDKDALSVIAYILLNAISVRVVII